MLTTITENRTEGRARDSCDLDNVISDYNDLVSDLFCLVSPIVSEYNL